MGNRKGAEAYSLFPRSTRIALACAVLCALLSAVCALAAYRIALGGVSETRVAAAGSIEVLATSSGPLDRGEIGECRFTITDGGAEVPLEYRIEVATEASSVVQDVRYRVYAESGGTETEIVREPVTGAYADDAMKLGPGASAKGRTYVVRYLPNEKGNLSFKTGIVAKQATS